nr:MAG TPA: hypothetical protein [Caudoviricetes sp.]
MRHTKILPQSLSSGFAFILLICILLCSSDYIF